MNLTQNRTRFNLASKRKITPPVKDSAAGKFPLPIFCGLAVSAILLFYYFFFLEGIPFEVDDVIPSWYLLTKISWGKMFIYLFNPISEYATAHRDLSLVSVRVLESLIFKGVVQVWGDRMLPIFLYNLVIVGFFAFSICLFVHKLTKNVYIGMICSIFLLTTPAFGWTIMEYGDFAPLDQLVLVGFVWFLVSQLEYLLKGPSFSVITYQWLIRLVILWAVGMIAIRTKETNAIIVFGLFWIMVLFNPTFNLFRSLPQKRRLGFIPLCLVGFLLTLPLILVKNRTALIGMLTHQSFGAPFFIFFQNPFGWEPEEACALFTLKRYLPCSILSNFGFFISWLFLIFSFCLVIYHFRIRKEAPPVPKVSYATFLIAWLCLGLMQHTIHPGYSFMRYLTRSLLPFTFFCAFIFGLGLSLCKGRWKKFLVLILITAAFFKIAVNIEDSVYIRKRLEKLWNIKWIFRREFYKDKMGEITPGLFELYIFSQKNMQYMLKLDQYILENDDRNNLIRDENFKKLLEQYGSLYAISSKSLTALPWKTTLLKEINPSHFSTLTRLKSELSSKAQEKILLYRIDQK